MFRSISEGCIACINGKILGTNADKFEQLDPPDLTCPSDTTNTITFNGRVACSGPTAEDIDKTSGQDTHLCHAAQLLLRSVRHEDRQNGGIIDWTTVTGLDASQLLPLQGVPQEDGTLYVTS